jgi:RNA polymerase sigma-54 factor
MALETKLVLKQGMQLVMTPQLRQAIKILQVSRAELEQLVDQELEENPVLEEDVDGRAEQEQVEEAPRTEERLENNGGESDEEWPEPTVERETATELEPESGLNAIDWNDYLTNYSNDWHAASSTPADYDDEKRPSLESMLVRAQSLTEHLIWQLQMNPLDEEEQAVTALLIGNMDKDGYLQLQVEEIAFQSGKDFEVVERALQRIHELDPRRRRT